MIMGKNEIEESKDRKPIEQPSLAYTSSPDYGKPSKIPNGDLQSLGTPHIESFNYMLEDGLRAAIDNIIPIEFVLPTGERIELKIEEAGFSSPSIPIEAVGVKETRIFPTECRQRGITYKGDFKIRLSVIVDGKPVTVDKSLGKLPIMVKSKLCNLANMSPEELVKHNEHADEWGGYFIIKGHERLARMLLVTRRNYPVAIKRPNWKMRGNLFTDYGVFVRCVTSDQVAVNNVLHYLQNGTCKFMFTFRRVMYFAPLVLIMKCLVDYTDYYIYRMLLLGKKDDLYYANCVQNMLRELHEEGLHTSSACRQYLGKMFRVRLSDLTPWKTDLDIADYLLQRSVLTHLKDYKDKFHTLVFMTQKLYDFARDKSKVEGADGVMCQELLMGGHLYLQILKERLEMYLFSVRKVILKKAQGNKKLVFTSQEIQQILRIAGSIDQRMESFLSTGNAPSNNINLPQHKGLTILAENINRLRYMSHFRAIHRGAFFVQMRTTETRQLLPDAWGFVCPVHTPDGAPCGLLNHLTMGAQVTQQPDLEKVASIPNLLVNYGMECINTAVSIPLARDVYKYPVFVDGRLVGYFPEDIAHRAVAYIRTLKSTGNELPVTTEIVLIPRPKICGQHPGVFIFTTESRMMRPVLDLATGQVQLIGTMEQLYLEIAVTHTEICKGRTTHLELTKSAFLSNLALLIPMPDCNQSPRNMYQCQMSKQTMGTPIHTWGTNAETKMYRLQTPATPLFRPTHYDRMALDDFPLGTNAIVAVISYTGYDMEDAMVINKSSYERGLAGGCIYISEFIELNHATSYFCRDNENQLILKYLDQDGLPPVGIKLQPGDPLCCYYDGQQAKYVVKKFLGKEDSYVDSVRLCGEFSAKVPMKACVVLRVPRNPSVGDKFASRAGQKGICSQLWPSEDLPFTETGLVPDIMFNPHGFPSRMTIAMMIECMAGKAASLHGHVHDATPFRFNEKDTAIDYFGQLLEAGGYNYYGTERMYSGVDGREMEADIFFGVIHYQRLRHMVSDKWQVRTTGPVDAVTRQPVQGRRRGGGVRLGEMERDALLAHGAAFLLQDRLLHCSDKTDAILCTKCGTLLGPIIGKADGTKEACRLCGEKGKLAVITIPYIFKYFVVQLASVNINVKIDCNMKLAVKRD